MNRAGFLAFPAIDAGTGTLQAVETEMGRNGEEKAERADSAADRPVEEYRQGEEQEKHHEADRKGQREEIIYPGVVYQVDIVEGSDYRRCEEAEAQPFEISGLFISIFLPGTSMRAPVPTRPDRGGHRTSFRRIHEPDPYKDPDDSGSKGLAGGHNADQPDKFHRHQRGEDQKAEQGTHHDRRHCNLP